MIWHDMTITERVALEGLRPRCIAIDILNKEEDNDKERTRN